MPVQRSSGAPSTTARRPKADLISTIARPTPSQRSGTGEDLGFGGALPLGPSPRASR